MKSSSVRRWDLVVGALASLIAVAGFLLSISLGNTATVGFGFLAPESQKFMLILAAVFLILVAIKAAIRFRCGDPAACEGSLDRLLKRRRRGA